MRAVSLALRHGVAAAQAQQFERARPLLQRATAESPDDAVAWFWLAVASPTPNAAIPCLRRVLAIDESHPRAREVLANLLVTEAHAVASAGNYAEARGLAAEASQLSPDTRAMWLALASRTDNPAERIAVLRQAADAAPDDAVIRTRLRQALLTRGVMIAGIDRVEARACFREAAALDPSDQRVWQALANLADSRAEWLEALRDLLRAAPDHARGQTALRTALAEEAWSLVAKGRTDEACERWREACAIAGGDVESWLGLAAITADQDEAGRAVETAYALDPADERVVAAMDRVRAPQIDPAAIEPPADAFARFGVMAEALDSAEIADVPLAQIDALLGAFADLDVQAPSSDAPFSEVPAAVAPPMVTPPPVVTEPLVVVEPLVVAETPVVAEPVVVTEPVVVAPPPVVAEPVVVPESVVVEEPVVVAERVVVAEPLVAEPEIAAPQAAAPEAGSNGTTRLPRASGSESRGHTVMIVDDSPTIRKILGLSLERAGYTVVAEPDGESAIERLLHIVPDLILLDIAMPGLDGYEVCKRIKQDPRTASVPVVMLSGKGAFFDKVKGHMAGATQYLTKPFETPAVLAVVSSFCPSSTEVAHG